MKKYNFEFDGSTENFKAILYSYPNNNYDYFYFDDFIVDLRDEKWKFGVAPGGHSGGYWFIPTVSEQNGKIVFNGEIQYIDSYTPKTKFQKIKRRFEEIMFFLFWYTVFLPIALGIHLYVFISKQIKKHKGIPPEKTEEDNLYDLMENYLKCRRCEQKNEDSQRKSVINIHTKQ